MNREAIFAALFKLVSATSSFKTASRRLKLWSDVNASDKPAIYLAQRPQKYVQGGGNLPQKVTLEAQIIIYTNAGKDPNVVPATQMNALVDAIDSAIGWNPVRGQQTLGGLVTSCWIEGDVFIDPGDLDGDGVAIIPVKILVP